MRIAYAKAIMQDSAISDSTLLMEMTWNSM